MRHTLLALCLVAASCKPASTASSATLVPVDMGPHPSLTPLPDPDLQGGHVGRAPRRITVDQLKASILTTTGRQWSQIDRVAASLGRADYALANIESIEANLVFTKFLEDGAREVCLAVAADDLTKPSAADRVLSREVPATVTDVSKVDDATARANLQYLSKRFWGEALSGDELDGYVATFKTIAARAKAVNQSRQAWGAMCIALMTDSRFFTY